MDPVLVTVLVVVFSACGIAIFSMVAAEKRRKAAIEAHRARIYVKYGHTEIAELILKRTMWVGQTPDQLLDSLGQPADTDQKVLKTKTKVVWKYFPRGANRYGLRVTVENNVVVGWDEKL